jgi:hypothetical protein
MKVQLDKSEYFYEEVSPQIERTKEKNIVHRGTDLQVYDVITSKTPSRVDDSTVIRQISDDDERSALFQERLFMETAARVLRRNRKLFEELAKY